MRGNKHIVFLVVVVVIRPPLRWRSECPASMVRHAEWWLIAMICHGPFAPFGLGFAPTGRVDVGDLSNSSSFISRQQFLSLASLPPPKVEEI